MLGQHTFKAQRWNRNSSLTLAHYTIKPHTHTWCASEGFLASFWRVLESLVSPTNVTSKLALAEQFTSKRCQRNALPSHLNGNVSQSSQPFSFQYEPSIFAHQLIFSFLVFSTLLYLTFPSDVDTCELPQQPFIQICQWELNFHSHSCRKTLLATDGVNVLTLVLKRLPGD